MADEAVAAPPASSPVSESVGSSPPPAPQEDVGGGLFEDLAALGGSDGGAETPEVKQPAPKPAPEPKIAADKAPEVKTPPAGRASGVGVKEPVPAAKTGPTPPPELPSPDDARIKAPELRAAYAKVKSDYARLKAEHDELRSGKPTEAMAGLMKQNELHEQTIKGLKEQIAASDWTQSDEYRERFIAPVKQVILRATELAKGIRVTDPRSGEARAGTMEDFLAVLGAASTGDAADIAEEIFGATKAPLFLHYRDKIGEVEEVRNRELAKHTKEHDERSKLQTADDVRTRERLYGVFKGEQERGIEKLGPLVTVKDGDDGEKGLVDKGEHLANVAFFGCSDITPEDMAKIQASVWLRSSRFGLVVSRMRKLEAEKAALEEKLNGHKKSAPNADDGSPATNGAGGEETLVSAFERLMMAR